MSGSVSAPYSSERWRMSLSSTTRQAKVSTARCRQCAGSRRTIAPCPMPRYRPRSKTIDASTAGMAAKLCLRFLILTAARSGEARGATWSELDLGNRLWTIPAERMKGGAEHRVPLSDAALAVLHEAAPLCGDNGLVFPSPRRRGSPLSDMTLTKVLRDCGLADRATVHGFRSAFRDWAAESTNAPHAVMERALAHTVADAVEAAYMPEVTCWSAGAR